MRKRMPTQMRKKARDTALRSALLGEGLIGRFDQSQLLATDDSTMPGLSWEEGGLAYEAIPGPISSRRGSSIDVNTYGSHDSGRLENVNVSFDWNAATDTITNAV